MGALHIDIGAQRKKGYRSITSNPPSFKYYSNLYCLGSSVKLITGMERLDDQLGGQALPFSVNIVDGDISLLGGLDVFCKHGLILDSYSSTMWSGN